MEWMILVTVRLCMSGGDDSELQCYKCGSSYVSATFHDWFRLLLTLLVDVSKRNDQAGKILEDGRWSIMWMCYGEWQIMSICEDCGLPFQQLPGTYQVAAVHRLFFFFYYRTYTFQCSPPSALPTPTIHHHMDYGPYYRHYDTLRICKFTDSPRFANLVYVHPKKC